MPIPAILGLELARTARRERTYWLRTIYVTFLATIVALAWLSGLESAGDWSRQEDVGHGLFVVFAWVQFVLLGLAATVSLAGSIAEERRRGTLPVLLTTELSSLEIVLGKLMAGLVPVGLLLVAGLPVMFLLLVFGGLSPLEVGAAFALTVASAVLAGAVTLYVSSLVRTGYIAFGVGAGAVLLYAAAPSLFGAVTPPPLSERYNAFSQFRDILDPNVVVHLYALALPVAAALGLALGFVGLATIPLRQRAVGDRRRFGARLVALIGTLFRFVGGRRAGNAPSRPGPAENPVCVREAGSVSTGLLAGLRLTAWTLAGLAVLGYLGRDALMPVRAGTFAPGHAWAMPLLCGGAFVLVVVAGARAFAVERMQRTLEVLLSSPLDGRTILAGKLNALLLRLGPLLVTLPLAYGLFFGAMGALPAGAACLFVAQTVIFGFTLLVVSFLAGLLTPKINWALAGTAAAVAILEIFLALGWSAATWAGADLSRDHAFLPYWALLSWSDIAMLPRLAPRVWQGFLLCAGGHLLFAGLAGRWAVRRFDRLTGRC